MKKGNLTEGEVVILSRLKDIADNQEEIMKILMEKNENNKRKL